MRQRVQWQQVLSQGVEGFWGGGGGGGGFGVGGVGDGGVVLFHINQEKFQIQQFD